MATESEAVRAALDLEADLLDDLGDAKAAQAVRSRVYAPNGEPTMEDAAPQSAPIELDDEDVPKYIASVRRQLGEQWTANSNDYRTSDHLGDRASSEAILTVHPTQYRDVQAIADNFQHNVPIVINLSQMSDADGRRAIDFASGLSLGLSGRLERVTSKVFLLSPRHTWAAEDQGGISGSYQPLNTADRDAPKRQWESN